MVLAVAKPKTGYLIAQNYTKGIWNNKDLQKVWVIESSCTFLLTTFCCPLVFLNVIRSQGVRLGTVALNMVEVFEAVI